MRVVGWEGDCDGVIVRVRGERMVGCDGEGVEGG